MSIEKYIEDICFFEVNTKCISSNAFKISVISRVRSTSELLKFSTHEMKYIWYLPKKVNFLFILSIKGGGGGGKNLLQSFLNNFAWLRAFSGYNIGYKHSLHLENGL